MNRNIFFLFLLVMNFFISLPITAQDIIFKDSAVHMAAGVQYKATKWKELWWGKHYRKEWQVPLTFPVIDLDATAGGLTPSKIGGGRETKSLRLEGANGKEYVLRTMDKTLTSIVPEAFRGSFVNELVNDQISMAHPYGALAVARLSQSAGIYHTNPVIVFVPYNDRLKDSAKQFANRLCLFEERPADKGWENTALTGFATDVITTKKLIQRLIDDHDRKVDQKAFLKVRLFDIWINDWDRHEDQWVWLAHKVRNKTTYTPFARDRDQSLSKADGINLYFLSRPGGLESLQNLSPKVNNVIGSSLAARYIDKQFLNELSRQDWKDIITDLQKLLTDKAIEEGIHAFPDSIAAISGKHMIELLKSRRDDMLRFGLKYYGVLSKEVDIVGSDKKELFMVTKKSKSETEIIVQKISKENQLTDTLFKRDFLATETKHIYLYGLDGNDIFKTKGKFKGKTKIIIIGGKGIDNFIETKDSISSGIIKVYDDSTNRIQTGKSYQTHFSDDTLLINYNRKHFQYDLFIKHFIPGYNPDDGIFLGYGLNYIKKGWGKNPFTWQQTFGAAVAFKTGATLFLYNGRFTQLVGKWDVDIAAAYRGPQYVINFYGNGNETVLATEDRTYNRVRIKQLIANPMLVRQFGNQEFKFGLSAEHVKVEETEGKFITGGNAGINNYIFNWNTYLGANLHYAIAKTDDIRYPTRGYHFLTDITYKRNITNGKYDFIQVNGAISIYLPLGNMVLAHRTGFANNFGEFEFYHANTLGGNTNLRGYLRTRFTGKTSVYQNTELRFTLANLKGFVFRGRLGGYVFLDDGRVWIENDSSEKFNTGYGVGIYFVPFNAATLNFSVGRSPETVLVRFGLAFFF